MMDSSAAELALLSAWHDIEAQVPRAALTQEVHLSIVTAEGLAQGHPLSVERLSDLWNMPVDQTKLIFDAAKGRSIEVDQNGHLVGAAGLSLNQTNYELLMGSRTLYAWCAWDALFLPAYLDTVVTVRSTDPMSEEVITLEVAPTSVTSSKPETTVLTILVPSLDSPYDLQMGPGTARCSAMHFFAQEDTATSWVGDRTDLVILNPQQALDTAHRSWLSLTH